MLTSVHAAADVRIFHKEARALARAGHEVVVVGFHPADELRDSVRIIALTKRTNRIARMLLSPVEVFVRALGVRAQVYHFHDPELIPVALLLRLLGKRVIYDIHEYTAEDIATKHWIPTYARRPVSRLVGWIERRAVQQMDGVVVVNDHMADGIRHLVKRPDCLASVYNYPDYTPGAETVPAMAEREPVAVYVGVLTRERGWETLLDSGKRLNESFPEARVRVIGRLQSAGIAEPYRAIEQWADYGVEYEGQIAHQDVFARLQRARVGVIPWLPSINHEQGTPVKLFEYMMAGLPVVASDLRFIRQIVVDTQCGILVPPGDPVALSAAIEELLRDPLRAQQMGERGRRAVFERYSWATQAERLLKLYASVAAGS